MKKYKNMLYSYLDSNKRKKYGLPKTLQEKVRTQLYIFE